VTKKRQLEEIASNLDDMSVTLEEIKDQVQDNEAPSSKKLDKVQAGIEKATEVIDESLNGESPEE
jgi:methyl-accepting chemotaxis protein